MRRRGWMAAAVAMVTAAAGSAQDRFSDSADVLVVEIPVQVIEDGRPVRGLTADDFEVLEGRKRQPIVGFDAIDLTLTGDDPTAVQAMPVAVGRHFLFLFDLSFSSPASVLRAREAAQDLVARSLHPSDLAAVATYSSSQGVRIPLSFTSDRDQLHAAIETLAMPELVDGVQDPLGLVLLDEANVTRDDLDTGLESTGGAGIGAAGVDADAEIRAVLESIEREVDIATNRNSVLALTSSLQELGQLMGAVDGRKHVVYLSEGFDSSIVLGTRGSTLDEQRRIVEQNEAAMRGEVWSVDSNERFGDSSTQNQLTQMLQTFVDSGSTIEAVDIGGLRADGGVERRKSSDDALFYIANETGGELYRNFNDLGQAMGEMLERTSVTYLLAIQPEKVKYDGKYRRLKVRLKDGDRGVRIVHRPGYFAPRPYAELSPAERRLATAEQILSGREGGTVATSVLAAPFEYGPSSAYVPVLVEIDGEDFLAGHRGEALPTELYVYAIDAEGKVRDFIAQAMALDLAKTEGMLRQNGFKFWGNMELPPGDYSIRVAARNSASGASGTAVTSVRVPDFDGEGVLLPPMFPEPPGTWLLGRESGAENDPYPYPFLLDGQPYIPAARPLLRANGRAQVSLIGYGLGESSLAARAELFSIDGEAVPGAVSLTLDARPSTEAAGLDRLVASLEAADVAPGDYSLVVTVRDNDTGATQSSSIAVRVAG